MEALSNERYVCVMGPTAVGKTALAVAVKRTHPVELVSVDSAMVYRGLDIGSGKPDAQTLALAPHRLIDIRDPSEVYSVGDFVADARAEIAQIQTNGAIPLLVGGTALYFRALREGLSDLPAASPDIRAALAADMERHGLNSLHGRLAKVDPKAAERIHVTDRQRIQRALEIFELTGKSITQHFEETRRKPRPRSKVLAIAMFPRQRDALHRAIETRFDNMLRDGFLEEVRVLRERSDMHLDLPAVRAVGYRQCWDYLAGQIDVSEMRFRAIAATRQLARRQLTWLRGETSLIRIEVDVQELAHERTINNLAGHIGWCIDRWRSLPD